MFVYNVTKCRKLQVGEDWDQDCFGTARTSRNGAFIVFGCVVIFLPFCRRFSHFKRSADMSVKVKDVLDALQQMQKSLECSIWYERTV